jgi:hypothetical protein
MAQSSTLEGMFGCLATTTTSLWPQQQDLMNRLIANNWRNKFAKPLAEGLAITLTISLAVYALVRAIGWVIGGFAAS